MKLRHILPNLFWIRKRFTAYFTAIAIDIDVNLRRFLGAQQQLFL